MFGNMNDPTFAAFAQWYIDQVRTAPDRRVSLDLIEWEAFKAGWGSRIVPDPLQYRVVGTREIETLLAQGWRLYGDPFEMDLLFYQAMVK